MATSKIQTGDKVKVIAGNFKGSNGIVTKVIKTKKSKRVSVSGVSKAIKYRKKVNYQGQTYPGEMFTTDRTIDISNVMLLTPEDKVSKVSMEVDSSKGKRTVTRKYKSSKNSVAKLEIPLEKENLEEEVKETQNKN